MLQSRSRSCLDTPLLRWSWNRFFCWPEPRATFFFIESKKGKPCVVTKHDLQAVYNCKCDPKNLIIDNPLFKNSKLKKVEFAARAAWSRPDLVGAGFRISNFRSQSRSRPKKWRLHNTVKSGENIIQNFLCFIWGGAGPRTLELDPQTFPDSQHCC